MAVIVEVLALLVGLYLLAAPAVGIVAYLALQGSEASQRILTGRKVDSL